MSRPKYTYAVEVAWPDGETWRPIIEAETRDFCFGFLAAHRQHPGPRVAARVVRSDDKVMDSAAAEERASLGMIAGFPTPEQYEAAAAMALACAKEIRERTAKRGRS